MCGCGTEPTFDVIDGPEGRMIPVYDNGSVCFDCGAFTCDPCIAKATALDADFDANLCASDNRRALAPSTYAT